MTSPAPLHLLDMAVEPEWIDYNGHMNVGYYVVAFDRCTDELIDRLGMDARYRADTGCTVFVLELHVSYEREIAPDDTVRVDVQLIDFDVKRLHYFMRMHRRRDDALAATAEIMLMHVEAGTGRATPMPDAVLARVRELAARHAALPRPPQLGRAIGIRRRR